MWTENYKFTSAAKQKKNWMLGFKKNSQKTDSGKMKQ